MGFIVSFALKENFKRKGYYFSCLFASFIVCLVVFVSKTLSKQGSMLFLMMSEYQAGEMDIILKPLHETMIPNDNSKNNPYVNTAFINYSLFTEEMINGNDESNKIFNQSTLRHNIQGKLVPQKIDIDLFLINSEKERKLEIGRSYPHSELSEGECIVHDNILRHTENNTLLMELNMTAFIYKTLFNEYNFLGENIDKNILKEFDQNIILPCKIKKSMKNNYGKFNENNDKVIIMEHAFFYTYLSNYLPSNLIEDFPHYESHIKQINPNDYANIIIVNFPSNRVNTYLENDYNVLLEKGVTYANTLLKKLNAYSLHNIQTTMPLIAQMEMYNYGVVLINIIINFSIFVLFILSLILIYSLLMITIETNTFEFGSLRLLGSTKKDLIKIILMQCLSFSIPAYILAFGVHFIVIDLLNQVVATFIKTDLQISFSFQTMFITILINFLIPMTAIIMPVRRILQKDIAEKLNNSFNKTSGLKIEVITIEQREKTSMIILGIMTFFYGTSIYYFLPLSLISLNLGMLSSIFLMILLGIIIGFIMLSMNIENIIQKLVTNIIMICSKTCIKKLILKNLVAHRLKNRKTSIMYSLSVAVLIMGGIGLDMAYQNIIKTPLLLYGGEAIIWIWTRNKNDFSKVLKNMIDKGAIDTFAFAIPFNGHFFQFWIQNSGKSYEHLIDLVSITSGFCDASHQEGTLRIRGNQNYNKKKYNAFSFCEQLYLKENRGSTAISGYFTWDFDLQMKDEFKVNFKYSYSSFNNINLEFSIKTKPSLIIDSAAGFTMSNQPSWIGLRQGLMTLPMAIDILNKCRSFENIFTWSNQYEYSNFLIYGIFFKMTNKMPAKEAIDIIMTELSKLNIYFYPHFYASFNETFQKISSIVLLRYNSLIVVVLFFCFFNITASMAININAQKKEIAILRSIGMKACSIIYTFVGEGIVLIVTSSIIGTSIGSVLSYTMYLQYESFTKIPYEFSLQLYTISILVFFSIIGGLLSTIIPAIQMMRIPIAQLVKNN